MLTVTERFYASERKHKRAKVSHFVLILTIVMSLGATRMHFWRADHTVQIYMDGTPVQQASVWRSASGDIFISFPSRRSYLIYTRTREVYLVQPDMVWSLGLVGVSPVNSQRVHMQSRGKIGIDPRLVIGPRHIEFTTATKEEWRVRLVERD